MEIPQCIIDLVEEPKELTLDTVLGIDSTETAKQRKRMFVTNARKAVKVVYSSTSLGVARRKALRNNVAFISSCAGLWVLGFRIDDIATFIGMVSPDDAQAALRNYFIFTTKTYS